MRSVLACLVLGSVAVVAMGCSQAAPPEFKPNQGQPEATPTYPAGPYGVGKGSVISNLQFIGYANPMVNKDTMQAIQLADFYNPTGKDVFPPGSQYGEGNPKPTVILVDVASVWCNPCNYEAGNILPKLHTKYAPCGGEFVLQLADGPTVGTAAVPKNLYNWTLKYKVNYPSTIDPSYKLDAYDEAAAYPQNFIISTKDMTIVEVIAGAAVTGGCSQSGNECDPSVANSCPGETCVKNPFWETYESHLDKTRAGCMVQ